MSDDARQSAWQCKVIARRFVAGALVLLGLCSATAMWLGAPAIARTGTRAHPVSCVVPNLSDDSLDSAKRALKKAHCALGNVTEPHKHQGALTVAKQSARPGETLASGASVSVTLAPPRCVVPHLKGHSLGAAKRALDKAHCALGNVTKPSKHRGTLVVTSQGKRPGHKLANGAKVAVTLGPSTRS